MIDVVRTAYANFSVSLIWLAWAIIVIVVCILIWVRIGVGVGGPINRLVGWRRGKPADKTAIAGNVSTGSQRVWPVHEIQTYLARQSLLLVVQMCLVPLEELSDWSQHQIREVLIVSVR